MISTWGLKPAEDWADKKWSPMIGLSAGFHLMVLAILLFAPASFSKKPFEAIIYEIDLVEMPTTKAVQSRPARRPSPKSKATAALPKEVKAKRITPVKEGDKPVTIAKRTIKKRQAPTVAKPKASPSRLIDKAISRIEKKVKTDTSTHIDQAIAKLEGQARERPASGTGNRKSAVGISIRIYQIEVENRIKQNWSYPVAMGGRSDFEAIVVIKVKKDGKILDKQFKKRSSNAVFDQSVLKAIERSDPLPPFPEGYVRRYDEIEINFNLRELQG
jgi:colicin import membrane protein